MSEVKRGLAATQKFHEDNSGGLFKTVQLKEDGNFKEVRVLQPPDEWLSLFMHRDWASQVPSTRCATQGDEPDMELCLLCAHGVGRQLRTYIPVRVRGDENQGRVQFFDYGRDNLGEVVNQVDELKEGQAFTDLDFKVKRQGKGTDTKYRWVPTGENIRPLTDDEKALVIPNLDELIPTPSEARQKILAHKFDAKNGSSDDDGSSSDGPGKKRTPF